MDSERRKGSSAGEGSFEDADKANDFLSQSHQHYDLRHTIPGEPHIDYPIYSAVPKTSFSCAQKHEGYYADMESRCQAFRICTNTARHTAGFGFLCPNGTLFSQRHFVCDWYRNVRCEESEQFYNKNAHNRISNHYEMMQTVRQMIEYPMKTISKALTQKPVQTKLQAPRSYTTNQQMKAAPKPTVVSFTASQTAPSYGTTLLRPIVPTTPKLQRSESQPALSNTKRTKEVYVNSFGELSTDPGSKFDPNTARIIAKPGRALNFAESINFGLNEYFPASNRSQKKIGNVDGFSSNLNILRHEIQADLSAKKSVHRSTSSQEASASSNFISHGFSKSKKDYMKSTHYQFPKQSVSTAKFSSNDFSTDTHKQKHIHTQNSQDVEFTFMKTTPSTPVTVDSFLINSLFDFPNEPFADNDDFETTNADDVEELFFQDNSVEKTYDNDDAIQIHFTSSTETPTSTTTTNTRPVTTTTTEFMDTTITPETIENTTVESLPLIKETSNDLKVQASVEKANEYDDLSYLTNLNLVGNLVDNEAVMPKTTTTTTDTTTTNRPETDIMRTSTEMIMSVKSVETHVRSRSHRRQNSSRTHQANTANLAKSKIHHIRRSQLKGHVSTTTAATPIERATIIKERLQHHSHHAHQLRQRTRTTTTASSTTTVAPNQALNLASGVSENDTNAKLNVRRNIEGTSVDRGNSLSTDRKNMKANARYGSINQQRRRTTTTTSTTSKPTSARNRQNIIRSRGSQTYQRASRTTSTTTTTKKPASAVENLIGKSIEIIPFNVSLINSNDSTTTTKALAPLTTVTSSTTSIPQISNIHTNQTDTLHNEIVDTLLPFNALTRAIVDESILQSYRNNQHTQQFTQYKQPSQLVPIFPTTPTKSLMQATKPAGNLKINKTQLSHFISNLVFPQAPNIVIARAEGQRIGSTSHAVFVPQQQQKASKVSSGTSYESLNEFLHKKFGQTTSSAKPTTHYYNTLQQRPASSSQEQTKHIVYAQPAQQQQQIYPHRTILSNLQQQQQIQHHPQQPQLTFFNNNQLTLNSQANNYRQPQQTGTYRNFKLPTLNDGIIPAAYTQVAQRRLDTFNFELETTTSPRMKLFTGVSSYDVPLSSVGRLPNDISQRLRRL